MKKQVSCNSLASYAVYRELYDSKKDAYGIISEFLKEIISSQGLFKFNIAELSLHLKNDYEFEIPDAIIKTALKRLDFVDNKQGLHFVNSKSNPDISSDIKERQQKIVKNNEEITKSIFQFIEKDISLTLEDKEKVVQTFTSFLLYEHNSNDKYIDYISAFFLERKENKDFIRQLDMIREGVILYSGLRNNIKLNQKTSFNHDLTIYLDTEILFHFAGYNGALYQNLFNDFHQLVKDINKSSKKIYLKVFKETEDEINSFFKKAEFIMDKPSQLDPSKTAMSSILNGCKSPSDIIDKKTSFFCSLENSQILLDDYQDYTNEKNFKYNLLGQSTVRDIAEDLSCNEYDIANTSKKLNYINIHRQEKARNNFDDIGYILLSGNSKTFNIAWHSSLKTQGTVPLVTHLDFLTNRFWLKLNKGFGTTNTPKTFSVITKAQVLLSAHIDENVNKKYLKLQEEVKGGHLTEEQIIGTITNLRKEVKRPEDIQASDITDILHSIEVKDIEKYTQEQEFYKNKATENLDENKKLKENLAEQQSYIEEQETQANKVNEQNQVLENDIVNKKEYITQQAQILYAEKSTRLQDKKDYKRKLEEKKLPIDSIALKAYNKYKMKVVFFIVAFYAIFYFAIIKFGWDNMEQYTWAIAVAGTALFTLIYTVIQEKTFNILEILNNKKEEFLNENYLRFKFDQYELQTLTIDIDKLSNEIDEIRKGKGVTS